VHQVNRNKRSIGLSFAHPAGVDILHRLVKECDVLVENYLPGSLAKYAMDYATVSKINPVSQDYDYMEISADRVRVSSTPASLVMDRLDHTVIALGTM
jgi:hypothetical protein